MLLQKQFGMTQANGKMMRVVPLFETLNDLTNAPKILRTLFKIGQYMGAAKGEMEVMVGYSDSAKDAGRYVLRRYHVHAYIIIATLFFIHFLN
jgi:phosphoenolpyruvate carboxylase